MTGWVEAPASASASACAAVPSMTMAVSVAASPVAASPVAASPAAASAEAVAVVTAGATVPSNPAERAPGSRGACRARRFSSSAPTRIKPLMVRKMAAASGFANSVLNWCSKRSPAIPTGMVATMSIHAIRWSAVSIRRVRSVAKNPPMIRTQSRQKKAMSARAVATWRPTTKAR